MRKNPGLYNQLPSCDSPAPSEPVGSTQPPPQPAAAAPPAPPAARRKPEVLSPAGGWPQLRAAVECGADAVYFGVDTGLNARARAANFALAELPEVMCYLHDRGVKGYLTLNVLVFDEELAGAERLLRAAAAAGVDAVIVQDVGIAALAARVAPALRVHASTQMSVTSPEGAQFAAQLGARRVVVGRELSVPEVAAVVERGGGAEVEAFVHGALCVSYSGQCFSSEAWGGRSANRGQCAQACRLPYGLIVDGKLCDLHDVRYLLSPQDLAALDLVPELLAAGVSSLKIEGRLKGPEYVALTTTAYRQAVDCAWEDLLLASGGADAGRVSTAKSSSSSTASGEQRDALWRDLRQVFARGQDAEHSGLTPGFLAGTRHQEVVRGRAPRHRGVLLGTVQQVSPRGVEVLLYEAAKLGDGVVFDQGNPQAEEQGGQIYDLWDSQSGVQLQEAPAGTRVQLGFAHGQIDARGLHRGDLLWRNRDPQVESRLRATYERLPASATRRLPVHVAVSCPGPGAPVCIAVRDDEGNAGAADTKVPAQVARGAALGREAVEKAVGSNLGGAGALMAHGFDLSELVGGLFVPGSVLKEARRAAVAQLLDERDAAVPSSAQGLAQRDIVPQMMGRVREQGEQPDRGLPATAPTLRVLCRSKAQVQAALQLPWLNEIVLDFLEVHGLREACAAVRAVGRRVVVATPRVLKPGEERLAAFYLRLGADALLLRSAGLLHQLAGWGGQGAVVPGLGATVPALEGDFSLNVSNALSADVLLGSGLARLAPTHDCNAEQLQELARTMGSRASLLEVVAHQHLPVFHTEHCVYARFLSSGNSFLDCGHPCESSRVHLRDEKGADHLVLADMGCRNTVFGAQAQSALPYLPGLVAAGVGAFRIELVDEPAEYVAPLLEGYRRALEACAAPGRGWREQRDRH